MKSILLFVGLYVFISITLAYWCGRKSIRVWSMPGQNRFICFVLFPLNGSCVYNPDLGHLDFAATQRSELADKSALAVRYLPQGGVREVLELQMRSSKGEKVQGELDSAKRVYILFTMIAWPLRAIGNAFTFLVVSASCVGTVITRLLLPLIRV